MKKISKRELSEREAFKISFWAAGIIVIMEYAMAMYSRSQTVLMDAAFDGAELIVIAMAMFLTPLFYKPISEKRPFGYFQCENLFIFARGLMMAAITVNLIWSNVQLMLTGGNHINSLQVAMFEMLLVVICSAVLFKLKDYSEKLNSPSIEAEIYGWKVDCVCGLGVSLAFLIPPFLEGTALSFIVPYFDQIIAIILAMFIIPTPIKMIIVSFKSIALFAPPERVTDSIKENINEVLERYYCEAKFIDITQTGRRLWVTVSFTVAGDSIEMAQLKRIDKRIEDRLKDNELKIDLELIPVWDDMTFDIEED